MKTRTAAEQHIEQLYHYQSFEKTERLVQILSDEVLYFSRPRDFNDPWDCRPSYSKSALSSPAEYERTVQWFVNSGRNLNPTIPEDEHLRRESELRGNRELLEGMIDQMTDEIDSTIQGQYRVYCLSTHPDSILMWSHYADSCRGICLEFSVRNDLLCGAMEVEYRKSYPSFNVAATNDDENLMPLLTKSDDWAYEDEFRLIATEHPFVFPDVITTRDGFFPLPKDALQSVIIGPNMPDSDRDRLRSMVEKSGLGVDFKVANIVPDHYKIEIAR